MFANMKVLGVKDMSPILGELKRVKSYMDKAKQYDNRITKSNEKSQAEQEKLRISFPMFWTVIKPIRALYKQEQLSREAYEI